MAPRVGIVGRFVTDLRECGMTVAGKDVEHWQTRMDAKLAHGRGSAVWHAIKELKSLQPADDVRRT